jgi:hypothetical protein
MLKNIDYALEHFLLFIQFPLFGLLLTYFRLNHFKEIALSLRQHSIRKPKAALTIKQVTQRYSPQLVEVVVVEEHVATS